MQSPEEFPFPFPPYGIQEEFMKNLYSCLEEKHLGVFESPTGTGKTMSIICGAARWLMDHEEYKKQQLESQIEELEGKLESLKIQDKGDWFETQIKQIELNGIKHNAQTRLNKIVKCEKEREELKTINKTKGQIKKKNHVIKEINDQDFILEEILSNSDNSENEEEEETEDPYEKTKIYFCSRTHSQLSQFINELKKCPYNKDIAATVLSSRQNYCINKSVRKLKSINLINERCLQLQKKKTTSKAEKKLKKSKITTRCPYMPGDQKSLIANVVSEIQDVEEIIKSAKELDTCPYYALRQSIKNSQIIAVPYNTILHKNTRNSSGIDLKDNILIIDEAHNLLDAIENIYSASITGRHLLHCHDQLSQYQKRYQSQFSAKSILYLNQLNFCIKKLLSVFGATTKSQPHDIAKETNSKLFKIEEFEIHAQMDTINIFELLKFVKESKLAQKLQGYVTSNVTIHENNKDKKKSGVEHFLNSIQSKSSYENINHTENEQGTNNLIVILSFLECLGSDCTDGRVVFIPGSTVARGIIKFLLLNPAARFNDIVKDARSVVLTGGTMEPVSEFTEQLFLAAGGKPERIITFSCDHVIPKENILSNIVTRGPNGIEFEFNYQNRSNTILLDELGRVLSNLCNIVPSGMIVFLPSYNYEEFMYKHFQEKGILTNLTTKKRIFREPKSTVEVNKVLQEYGKYTKNPRPPQNGSLLFSVVGGKLSEGLNFSDELGRCVVVVGMPYPNIKSLELQEKMKYLNEHVKPGAGQIFYENSCMKAVNQCIGRSIRHINDYSTVILLDKRYSNKTNALPRWIKTTLTINETFAKVISNVAKFFKEKNKIQ